MRIPSIILLSSAALALLVQAENASPNAPIAVPVLAGPVAASPDHDTKAQAQTPMQVNADDKYEKKPAEAPPKDEAANDVKANNNEPKDTKDAKYKTSDARPVGKGIVMTTTSFSKSKNGGFLNNLLGIDLDLNIGVDGGDKKTKKTKKTKTTKNEGDEGAAPAIIDPDFGDVMEIPDDVPLHGDDGYVPRPLPVQPTGQPPCPPLVFMDQVVWDMQGSLGKVTEAPLTPPSPPAPVTTAEPQDATAPATLPGAEIDADQKATANAAVHPDGLRICILALCIGGPPKKHIHHNQRKFLRQIAKRTPLSIDGRTGCPIPSMEPLLKFWAQSFLPGIPTIIVGFRDDDGNVVHVQTFKTMEIPRLVRGKEGAWDTTICINFLDSVLSFLKRLVVKDDPTLTYTIRWAYPFQAIEVEFAGPRHSFLTKRFLDRWERSLDPSK
ncbi:Dom-3 Z [Podila clonocystis]|nr:Dom-3 Z [Podila clonocystis]